MSLLVALIVGGSFFITSSGFYPQQATYKQIMQQIKGDKTIATMMRIITIFVIPSKTIYTIKTTLSGTFG
jgi:hypothetical protein